MAQSRRKARQPTCAGHPLCPDSREAVGALLGTTGAGPSIWSRSFLYAQTPPRAPEGLASSSRSRASGPRVLSVPGAHRRALCARVHKGGGGVPLEPTPSGPRVGDAASGVSGVRAQSKHHAGLDLRHGARVSVPPTSLRVCAFACFLWEAPHWLWLVVSPHRGTQGGRRPLGPPHLHSHLAQVSVCSGLSAGAEQVLVCSP